MSDQRGESAYEPGAVFTAFLRAHGAPVPLDRETPPASEAEYAAVLEGYRRAHDAANATRGAAHPDLFHAFDALAFATWWQVLRGVQDGVVKLPAWVAEAVTQAWELYEDDPDLALEDAFGLRHVAGESARESKRGVRDPRGKQATLARNRNLALDIATIEKVGPGPGFKGPPEKLAYAIAEIAQRSGVAAPSLEKLWQPLAEAARAAVARQMAAFGLDVDTPPRA
jgi:hypothetical protein